LSVGPGERRLQRRCFAASRDERDVIVLRLAEQSRALVLPTVELRRVRVAQLSAQLDKRNKQALSIAAESAGKARWTTAGT
jgi:hypothetical protein